MSIPLAISTVLGSCCGCMIFVEYLAHEDPGSMNLMTFSAFLFIAVEGFISQSKFGRVKNKIPIKAYLEIVVIFFGVNVINNQALNFHIPVPLHIIFRSGSLIANMLLGMWLLKKRYTLQKYLSVVMVTAGIIVCTLASSNNSSKKPSSSVLHEESKESHHDVAYYTNWIIGLMMLWVALLFSALLGIRQEQLYTKYGKHNREALFYVHALSLPGFIIMIPDIYKHVLIFNQSDYIYLPMIGIGVPRLWLFLIFNDLTQYICISSVYKLTAECASLTVTLVVTLRKFISLLVSIVYFGNPFSVQHWLGTVLVFGGTLLFADIFSQIKNALFSGTKSKPE